MKDRRGNRYEMPIGDGIDPEQLAAIMTKRIRSELSAGGNGFNGPLDLPAEQFI